MKKSDVRAETLLAWDEYKGKPFEAALPAMYSHAKEVSKASCEWYWTSIKTKRLSSLGVRLLTFALLIVGTILPILAGLGEAVDARLRLTQLGVAALAFAGLLQVADRVFGWSSGWLRYMTTVTAMENRARKFESDWASYLVDRGVALGDGDTKPLFGLARAFESDIAKLRSDETDKWVAEFNSSLALLSELIKSQRESGEKSIEAARAAIASSEDTAKERDKAARKGSVELSILNKPQSASLLIAVDQGPATEFAGLLWARRDLEPGQHLIDISLPGGKGPLLQKIIEVPPGGVARAELKLP